MPNTRGRPAAGPSRAQHVDLAREAKAIVAIAFRNGPIEDIHAGKICPRCRGRSGFARITDAEMKRIMKNAVDNLYRLLWLRESDSTRYRSTIDFGSQYTASWDEPAEGRNSRANEKEEAKG